MPSRQPSSRRTLLLTIFAVVLALAVGAGTFLVARAATFSDQVSVTGNTFTTADLEPPTGLSANAIGPNSIFLEWTASTSPFAAGYNIYRSPTQGSGYLLEDSVAGGSTTTYTDSGLASGTPYYYVVEAYFQNWTSVFSSEASATTEGVIRFRAKSQAGSNFATSLSVAMPIGTVEGDLMIATMTQDTGTGTLSAPAGWTLIEPASPGSEAMRTRSWYRVAQSGESGPYQFTTSSSGNDMIVHIVSFYHINGVGGWTLEDSSYLYQGSTSNSITSTSVNGVVDSLLFTGFVNDDNESVTSEPSAVNEVFDQEVTSLSLATYYQFRNAGGAVTKSITWGGFGEQLSAIASVFTWTPAATVSGTITPSATEAEVVSGGRTIIITLSGDTWDPTIGQDNAKTTALINGIDSAQSEASGWDAVVKANMDFNDVVRTSDTVVTITLGAEPSYNITADETITVTVPATAVAGGSAISATPTFDIIAPVVGILDAWTTGTTHSVSSGTDRLLLVGVYGEDSGVISSINTVTWGGQTLTEINEATVGTGPSNIAWMGYLDETGIAAASGSTIVPTWSGAAPDRSVLYAAVTLENVDQTTPISGSSTGTSINASTVQIASALGVSAGDMAAYVTVSGEVGLTHTPDSGYIEGTEEDSGGGPVDHGASNATKAITSAGSEQPTATWSGTSVRLAIVGGVINVAP